MPRKAKPRAMAAPYKTGSPMQAPAAGNGQPYGTRGAQIDAQRAVPLPAAAVTGTQPPAPPPAAADPLAAMAALQPPTPLTAPTERPDEPFTTGLGNYPIGGPPPNAGPDPLLLAQALYKATPNADLADLIQHLSG